MKKLQVNDFLYVWSQEYGDTIYEVVNVQQCSCGQKDKVVLQIVANNNFGYDGSADQFFPYNEKKGYIFKDCTKNIKKAINQNKMKLFSEKEKIILQQQLLNNELN